MAIAHVLKCTTDPISAPDEVGQHWINTTTGTQFLASGTTAVSDWILIGVSKYFQASQQAAQIGITAGVAVDMVQTKNSASSLYTWDTVTDSLTIASSGVYKFSMTLSADTNTGARETSLTKLQRDTGGGFLDIPASEAQSFMYGYHRNAASGENTLSLSTILTVTAADVFRMNVSSTTGTIDTIAEGTGLIVESL